MAYIQFLGAAGTVTGSKHLINTGDDVGGRMVSRFLIDCGLFQGPKEWRERNWQDTPVPANEIDAVILTHAHLDHCGWIPRLVKEGFRGPIYATSPTIDLCGIILPDSGHLQEEDARFYNKIKKSKHDPALPLYTFDEAQSSLQYFKPVRSEKRSSCLRRFRSASCVRRTFWDRAWPRSRLQTNGETQRLLFTGDIGRVRDHAVAPGKGRPLRAAGRRDGRSGRDGIDLRQPDASERRSAAGTGETDHGHGQSRRQRDRSGVRRSSARRNSSSSSKHLIESGQIPRMPVFCDSPMAIKAVEIFLKHDEEYSDETRDMIRKYGSPLDVARIHVCVDAGRVEEDQ